MEVMLGEILEYMCDVIDSSLFYDFVLYLRLLPKAFTFFYEFFYTFYLQGVEIL